MKTVICVLAAIICITSTTPGSAGAGSYEIEGNIVYDSKGRSVGQVQPDGEITDLQKRRLNIYQREISDDKDTPAPATQLHDKNPAAQKSVSKSLEQQCISNPQYCMDKARRSAKAGQHKQAAEAYEKYVSLAAQDLIKPTKSQIGAVFFELGQLYEKEGKRTQKKDHFEKAYICYSRAINTDKAKYSFLRANLKELAKRLQ